MHFKTCFCLVIISTLFLNSSGQPVETGLREKSCTSDSSHFWLRNQLVPLGLISGGIIIEAVYVKKDIQGWFPRTNTKADDYLRYVPIGMLYISDVLGSKHRNNVFNQTKFLLISELATGFLTQAIKEITNITRPNGGYLAFPSGHTSEAFSAATVFYNETIDYDPVLAYSGYLFSTATGVLRITNNRHWISDVLAGAGLGILITNLVYYLEPLKSWDPFKFGDKAEIIPSIDINSGIYCVSVRVLLK